MLLPLEEVIDFCADDPDPLLLADEARLEAAFWGAAFLVVVDFAMIIFFKCYVFLA